MDATENTVLSKIKADLERQTLCFSHAESTWEKNKERSRKEPIQEGEKERGDQQVGEERNRVTRIKTCYTPG